MKIQKPTQPDNWLYRDVKENERYFTKIVFAPDGTPDYPECTNEEKEQWEKEHQPEPKPKNE